MNTQVLISGAGPTGLTLAVQLAKMNIDFIIIDKKEGITELSKALGIQARTLELFYDMGIVDPFLEQGNPAGKGNIFVHGKKKGCFDMYEIGKGLSPYPYMLTLPQDKTEAILYNELKELGKEVLWDTELIEFIDTSQGVEAKLSNKDGTTQKVRAKYLVGCDGPSSFVRKQLGLKFEGDTQGKYFYVVDAQINWDLGSDDDFYNCFCKETFVAFIPMPGDRQFRIIGVFPKSYDNPDAVTLEQILNRVKSDSEIPMEIGEVNWHSVYKVHTRKADAFKKGNCLIAGDAGHVHTPAGGQGMNTGIQYSYNLAWKLKMVIDGQGTDHLLESYSQEREQNAQNLLEGTDRAFDIQSGDSPIYVLLRMYIIPRIANWLLSFNAVKQRLFPIFSQINIKYPASSLTMDGQVGSIEAGDRFPYFVQEDGKSVYILLKGNQYKLIVKGSFPNLAVPNGIEILRVTELPIDLFGTRDNLLILVRPDNYISYIGDEESKVETFFKSDLFADAI